MFPLTLTQIKRAFVRETTKKPQSDPERAGVIMVCGWSSAAGTGKLDRVGRLIQGNLRKEPVTGFRTRAELHLINRTNNPWNTGVAPNQEPEHVRMVVKEPLKLKKQNKTVPQSDETYFSHIFNMWASARHT